MIGHCEQVGSLWINRLRVHDQRGLPASRLLLKAVNEDLPRVKNVGGPLSPGVPVDPDRDEVIDATRVENCCPELGHP